MNIVIIIAIVLILIIIFVVIGIFIFNSGNTDGCITDKDCGEKEICNTVTKKCKGVECKKNGDCTISGQICMNNICKSCGADNPCLNGKSCINGVCTFPINSYFLKTNGKYLSLKYPIDFNDSFILTSDKRTYFIIGTDGIIRINIEYYITAFYKDGMGNFPVLTTDTTAVKGKLLGNNIVTNYSKPQCVGLNPTIETACYMGTLTDTNLLFIDKNGKGCPCGSNMPSGASILEFIKEVAK